jgi:hypothetical protein
VPSPEPFPTLSETRRHLKLDWINQSSLGTYYPPLEWISPEDKWRAETRKGRLDYHRFTIGTLLA